MQPEELKEQIINIVTKWLKLPHYRIFYFGSRVNGKADERSDLDIGIEAAQPVPLQIMSEIKSDLDELPILQKIDFVDFQMVSAEFRQVALKNIEVIYER